MTDAPQISYASRKRTYGLYHSQNQWCRLHDEKIDFFNPDYENAIQLLCIIPGVKHDSAVTIISEIGTDMSQFFISKRLCC